MARKKCNEIVKHENYKSYNKIYLKFLFSIKIYKRKKVVKNFQKSIVYITQ